MPGFFSRAGRASGRVVTSLFHLHRTGKVILGLLSVVSAWVAAINWPEFKLWLLAEWTHGAVVIAIALFAGTFLALCGAEEELETRKAVRVKVRKVTTDLRSVLHSNDATLHDVFIYALELSFRNESDKRHRAFFPEIKLFRKKSFGRWEPLDLSPIRTFTPASMNPKGLPDNHTLWFHEHRYELRPKDEVVGRFHVKVTSPEGAAAFLNRDLKVKVMVDVIGQREERLVIPLPKVATVR